MRSSRWLAPTLIATFGFFLILAVVTRSEGATKPLRDTVPKRQSVSTSTLIAEATVQTWRCQDKLILLGVRESREQMQSPWSLPKSPKYRRWVLGKRIHKQAVCLKQLHAYDDIIRRLQRGLAGTPMSGSEGALLAAGRRYGVSPYFIAGIAGTESSFGAAACSNNRFNAFGLSSCGSGWSVPYFNSWSEAYDFMARFLTGRTSVTRGWPHARTTYDFHGYAACSSCWGAKTAQHMAGRFGVGNSVRF